MTVFSSTHTFIQVKCRICSGGGFPQGGRHMPASWLPQGQSSVKSTLWLNWLLHRSVLIALMGCSVLRAWSHGRFHSLQSQKSSSAAWRSLQHDVFEVFLQDGVLDGVKDKTNIFCVYRGGEVVEERLPSVPPLTAERLHQERLEGAEQRHHESHYLNVM